MASIINVLELRAIFLQGDLLILSRSYGFPKFGGHMKRFNTNEIAHTTIVADTESLESLAQVIE